MSAHPVAKQGLENKRRSTKMPAMRHSLIFISAVILGACATAKVTPPNRVEVGRPPTPFVHPDLVESSGVAVSRRHPGILWTHNDSGNDPLLFATDTLGRDLGAIVVSGAENRDWEDLAIGPCGSTVCLYVGDTGDNREVRSSVTLYRVQEPELRAASTQPAEKLELRYPGGARDAEAMYVDAQGDLYLITKGRSRGVLLFRVRQEAWAGGTTVAEALGSLPIDPQGIWPIWSPAPTSIPGIASLYSGPTAKSTCSDVRPTARWCRESRSKCATSPGWSLRARALLGWTTRG